MTADTISNQINRISNNIELAYSALLDKGATMPATNNSALLADTINTISTGGGGGSDEVGRYWVDNGIAKTQGGDIDGRFRGIVEIANSAMNNACYGLTRLTGEANFCNCQNVGYLGLMNCFNGCTNITGVNFCNLTNTPYPQGMQGAFSGCTNVGSVNFSSLQNTATSFFSGAFYNIGKNTVNGAELNFNNLTNGVGFDYAFQSAKLSPNVSFPSLTDASGFISTFMDVNNMQVVDFPVLANAINMQSCFNNCQDLTTVYMNSVVNVGQNYTSGGGLNSAFSNCYNLSEVNLSSLRNIRGTGPTMMMAFYHCTNLTNMYLPNLVNVPASGLQSCWSGCTSLNSVTIGGQGDSPLDVDTCIINGDGCNYGANAFQSAFYKTNFQGVIVSVMDTSLGGSVFFKAFSTCENLITTQVFFTNATNMCFSEMFRDCTNLSSIDLECQGADPNIAVNAFKDIALGCTGLSDVQIMLENTGEVQEVHLVNKAFYHAFNNSNSGLQVMFQGALTGESGGDPFNRFINGCDNSEIDLRPIDPLLSGDIYKDMLAGTNGCTVYFGADYQAEVETWASYTANFGGTNVSVIFD